MQQRGKGNTMKKKKIISILLGAATMLNTFGYVFAGETEMVETLSTISETETEVLSAESETERSEILGESVEEASTENMMETSIGSHEETSTEIAETVKEESEPELTEGDTELIIEQSTEGESTEEELTEEIETVEEKSEPEELLHATTSGMMTGGYVLSDADQNVPIHQSGISTYSAIPSAYPAAYQNSISYISSKYPANRDQNPYGTCWAFSTMGLAEFDLINKGIYTAANDLSELQLAYFAYNSVLDPLGGTAGDVSKYHNENTSVSYLNAGGNYEMAARRLMQWIGATNESDVPYSLAASTVENGLSGEYAYNHDVAHLDNAYIINIRNNAVEW